MQLFGPRAVWNQPCDQSPLHPKHATWMQDGHEHANTEYPLYAVPYYPFDGSYFTGMPRNYVDSSTPLATVGYHTDHEAYPGESDDLSGGVPIPDDVVIQMDPYPFPDYPGDPGDRHCLIIDTDRHILHEFYKLKRNGPQSYLCGGYFKWDLSSYALRPDGWTSADAAGLPIAPLLIDFDELQWATDNNTEIPHALRFTLKFTHRPHIWPARHNTSGGYETSPPMGMRVRLKPDIDLSGLTPHEQTIGRTLKKYGMYLADNGMRWELCFTYDTRWRDGGVSFAKITLDGGYLFGRDFEAVDDSYRQIGPDSMEVTTGGNAMDELSAEIDKAISLMQSAAVRIEELKANPGDSARVKALADKIAAASQEFAKALT